MKNNKERDIVEYQRVYNELPFEEYQVQFRRKKVLEHINERKPKRILEIGCGNEPLFKENLDVEQWIVVEPGKQFFKKAKAEAKENVILMNAFFEDCVKQILDLKIDIDYVVCSGLLHELDNPEALLQSIYKVCGENTIVHINVPNSKSIHRLLAVEMGLIQDVYVQSEQQKMMQQSNVVYDIESLIKICEKNGLKVINEGSYFVKPFTHKQMQQCLDNGVFDINLLNGLDKIIKYMPEYGSEIFVECKRIIT